MVDKSNPSLPLRDYFSSIAFLTFLLSSCILFLPRSTSFFTKTALSQRSSADRPEHPFLTPLTSDPLMTMFWDVIGTTVVMCWWGTKFRGWWYPIRRELEGVVGKEEAEQRQDSAKRFFTRVGQSSAASLASAILIAFLLVGLGAPLDSFFSHTFLLAIHLSLLLVFPVVYTLGIPSLYDDGLVARYRLTRLFSEFRADSPLEKALMSPIIGTIVGAWLGAFVIPLDWDRPWQSWPLTPTVGSTLGFIIGSWTSWASSAYADVQGQVAQDSKLQESGESKDTSKKGKRKAKVN